ncbi:MAG: hypothetical protein H7336_02855 [Bacteriovorax sp.]|nr:hypothetical protein [Bacteriovorax sp.]
MNFKIIFILILLSELSSCGVKAPPVKYPETVIDSYVRSYTGADSTSEELSRLKKSKPKEDTTGPSKAPTLIPQP